MKASMQSLNIMVTNQCPLQCAHCGPRSGPWAKGYLELELVISLLDEAKTRSCQLVNFTGGEPFILGSKLVEMVQSAAERGLIARVTTGAYWSNSAKAAEARLDPLVGAGLRQLFVSCSDAHRVYVPLSNIIEATRAARARGIEVYLALGTSKTSATNSITISRAFEAAGVTPPWMVESPLIPFGRAEETLSTDELLLQPVEQFAGPCPSLTQNVSIRPDGQITGCAVVFGDECPPLSYGNITDVSLNEALDHMHDDTLASWIHKIGVVELKRLIEANSELRFADRYVNICHLCGDILSNPEALALMRKLNLGRTEAVAEG